MSMTDESKATEWQINRNWIRSGDRVKVVGVRGISFATFKFVRLDGDGEVDSVEVVSERQGAWRTVRPATIRRVAQTKNGERRPRRRR